MSKPKKKLCGRCKEPKPIKDFGVCRARDDGRNLYCKPCVREKAHIFRAQQIEFTRAQQRARRQLADFGRRPNVLSPHVNKVKSAVEEGHRTREAIRNKTKLQWDEIGDALAELTFTRGELRIVRLGANGPEFHVAA